jgi:hypothetical protein
LLAANLGPSFTLAELVRRDINISSLRAVLAVLTREG